MGGPRRRGAPRRAHAASGRALLQAESRRRHARPDPPAPHATGDDTARRGPAAHRPRRRRAEGAHHLQPPGRRLSRPHRGRRVGLVPALRFRAQHRLERSQPPVHRSDRRRPRRSPDHARRHLDLVSVDRQARIWPRDHVPHDARRRNRAGSRVRRRDDDSLPGRHERRRPHRSCPDQERQCLLLAQPWPWPLWRQGADGHRKPLRQPQHVRSSEDPARGCRRHGHDRHSLPSPRRHPDLPQSRGERLRAVDRAPALSRSQRAFVHQRGGSARDRHGVPRLVVASAAARPGADALHRSARQSKAVSAHVVQEQPRALCEALVRAVDEVLSSR